VTQNSVATVNKNLILVIATTASFILPFQIAAVNIALPTMAEELSMEAVVMSWVSTVYFLAIAMVQVPTGKLSDIHGRRKFFVLGLVITTLASFLAVFANSVPVLILSRGLQGVGAGITFNTSVAILTSSFPPEERGRALGINMAGTYLGLSLGPLIGGFLTEQFGWKSIFLMSGILGVLLTLLVFQGLKGEWREAHGEKFDVTGSLVFSISVAMFMYGFSELVNLDIFSFTVGNNLISVPGYAFFVLGAIGLLFFIWWEARVPSPVFEFKLLRTNHLFMLSNLAALVTYTSTFAVTFLLSLYLQYIKGYSPQDAGLMLLASSVMMTVCTPISGRLSDKIEPRLVATAGISLTCLTLLMLIFVNGITSLWFIIITLVMYGAGIGLFTSPNTNAIMGSVESRLLGVASGTVGTMRTSGMMLSMGIMMILFSIYIGQAEITPVLYPQFLSSFRVGFIIFTFLGTGGVLAQLVARGAREKVNVPSPG
jgi:EmrB/QacA subfamily drug resistance transporter